MSAGGTTSARPSASTATPSARPLASRLTIAPASVSTIDFKGTILPRNSSGISVRVAPAALPMPERQVTGLSAHGDDEVPAPRGLRVDHQVVHDLDADRARGLIAEGPYVGRQVEIVVDRLGHVNDAQPMASRVRELVGGERGVIPPDGHQHLDAEAVERLDHPLHVLRTLGGVRAGDADARAAAEVDAARVRDGERNDVRDVPGHEPLKALLKAEDLDVR